MLKKITEGNISGLNVKSVPGVRLTGTVTENKNVFDKLPEFIAQTYNSLVDALSSSTDGDSGANCIKITPITGLTGTDTQAVIESIKALLDTMYNSSEVDEKLALKADKAVTDKHYKDVTFNEKTGVFTFIREDGTSKAIDTLLEKILVNFAYDPNTQTINFTAEDGTVYPVSISDFVTVNEFANSDTIDFTVLKGVVSAGIKAGSITEGMLNATVKASLEALKVAAETAATNAKASETNAKTYSENAKASETLSAQKASEASQHANEAAGRVSQAQAFAKTSESYAVGGTNTRTGEDTDNARFYSQQSLNHSTSAKQAQIAAEKARDEAQAVVGGDYVTTPTFNTHVGDNIIHITNDDRIRWDNKLDNTDIDCGIWGESPVVKHNLDPTAHSMMNIDGSIDEPSVPKDTLNAHQIDAEAHKNLVIDGNGGQ